MVLCTAQYLPKISLNVFIYTCVLTKYCKAHWYLTLVFSAIHVQHQLVDLLLLQNVHILD